MTIDLTMYDNATVEEVNAAMAEVLGAPLGDVLGLAYGDVEEWALTTMMGLPDDGSVLDKLAAEFGADRACEIALGMTLLIQAQARRRKDDDGK